MKAMVIDSGSRSTTDVEVVMLVEVVVLLVVLVVLVEVVLGTVNDVVLLGTDNGAGSATAALHAEITPSTSNHAERLTWVSLLAALYTGLASGVGWWSPENDLATLGCLHHAQMREAVCDCDHGGLAAVRAAFVAVCASGHLWEEPDAVSRSHGDGTGEAASAGDEVDPDIDGAEAVHRIEEDTVAATDHHPAEAARCGGPLGFFEQCQIGTISAGTTPVTHVRPSEFDCQRMACVAAGGDHHVVTDVERRHLPVTVEQVADGVALATPRVAQKVVDIDQMQGSPPHWLESRTSRHTVTTRVVLTRMDSTHWSPSRPCHRAPPV